jgi:hypothetical protein
MPGSAQRRGFPDEGGPENCRISGELCRPGADDSGLVQVLLAGGSYNHHYWDPPYQPESYSYVRHMNDAGYTTFNIDRIGTGASSHPPGALVTIPSNAFIVHQLVQKLRAGQVVDQHFTKVVLVGHSLGTLIGMTEASRYHDIDGFIATGIMHGVNLTSAPYFSATAVELGLFPVPLVDGTAAGVDAPVLIVMGAEDSIFCGPVGGGDCSTAETIRAGESRAYTNADVSAYVLADSGHCINLHRNAKDWFVAAESWLAATI